MFNEGEVILDEVLVLCVMDGRDYFILVYVDWVLLCIGCFVEEFIWVRIGGIREFCNVLVKKNGKFGVILYDLLVYYVVLKELFEFMEVMEIFIE